MKRKIRVLSLVLSILLLCATAFPASAACYYPGENFPTANVTYGYARDGRYYAAVTATPYLLEDIGEYRVVVPSVSGTHDGYNDTEVYANIGGEYAVFSCNQEFMQGDFYDALIEAGTKAGVTHEVYSEDETIDHWIPASMPRTDYQLYIYCQFASVNAECRYSTFTEGDPVTTQYISRMPYIEGVFFYLDY